MRNRRGWNTIYDRYLGVCPRIAARRDARPPNARFSWKMEGERPREPFWTGRKPDFWTDS